MDETCNKGCMDDDSDAGVGSYLGTENPLWTSRLNPGASSPKFQLG